jgi:hypothetical protein
MKDRPATFFFALAAGALYIFLAGLREFAAMRGPFVGELAHDGLESPLRWGLEAIHAYPSILHSNHGEFLFFGVVGTLMYLITGAFVGWIFDALLLRPSPRHDNSR